ncbi:MAG TPA: Mur ligase domain-containing protein [Candidatus Saccharimonadia bacterium]|nr:Mur ligase domain-containing protein [Candidatus Saccharimonadia bacterium]
MHIFFSGIGGVGISPLALIAHQAGFRVSGSDKQNSRTIDYLKNQGISDITIGQSRDQIEAINTKNKIDWFVYSSAISFEQPNSEEIAFCSAHNINTSKRDDFLNFFLKEKGLQLVAISGTHGKSTTTAMIIWLFKKLGIPISYIVGAKIDFGDSGHYDVNSKLFIYEADEFDNNFLSFTPHLSSISGVSWDHHEIFETRDKYKAAFVDFISKSNRSILWKTDVKYLNLKTQENLVIIDNDLDYKNVVLVGKYNRLDAYLAIKTVGLLTGKSEDMLTTLINKFPGLDRRMEPIIENLYSDYAHTPEKIIGAMDTAREIAEKNHQDIYVVYEPLTDRRQHYILNQYRDCFLGAKHVYWLPSYLAREDPKLPILDPKELISYLSDPTIASEAKMDDKLLETINHHLKEGSIVVAINGGGGNGLDEWLRDKFKS